MQKVLSVFYFSFFFFSCTLGGEGNSSEDNSHESTEAKLDEDKIKLAQIEPWIKTSLEHNAIPFQNHSISVIDIKNNPTEKEGLKIEKRTNGKEEVYVIELTIDSKSATQDKVKSIIETDIIEKKHNIKVQIISIINSILEKWRLDDLLKDYSLNIENSEKNEFVIDEVKNEFTLKVDLSQSDLDLKKIIGDYCTDYCFYLKYTKYIGDNRISTNWNKEQVDLYAQNLKYAYLLSNRIPLESDLEKKQVLIKELYPETTRELNIKFREATIEFVQKYKKTKLYKEGAIDDSGRLSVEAKDQFLYFQYKFYQATYKVTNSADFILLE